MAKCQQLMHRCTTRISFKPLRCGTRIISKAKSCVAKLSFKPQNLLFERCREISFAILLLFIKLRIIAKAAKVILTEIYSGGASITYSRTEFLSYYPFSHLYGFFSNNPSFCFLIYYSCVFAFSLPTFASKNISFLVDHSFYPFYQAIVFKPYLSLLARSFLFVHFRNLFSNFSKFVGISSSFFVRLMFLYFVVFS